MTDNERFREAEALLALGRKDEASNLFLDLFNNTEDIILRLNSGLELNRSLDQVQDREKLLVIASETIKLAQRLTNKDTKAIALCYKGLLQLQSKVRNLDKMKRINLSPDWFEFSLENDKDNYQEMNEESKFFEEDAWKCLDEAKDIAQNSEDYALKSKVYSMLSQAYLQKFFELRFTNLGKNWLQRWLAVHNYDHFFFRGEARAKLKSIHLNMDEFALKSIKIAEQADDMAEKTLACYNYANSLQSVNNFIKARKYIKTARKIADDLSDNQMLANIAVLEKRAKTRIKV